MRFGQPTAPHARPLVSVPVIMRRVLFALVPAMLCYTWYFGPGLLVNFALTASAALLTEAIVLQLRGRAGDRQVPGRPRVGYTHLYGAPGTGAVTVLTV